MNTCSLFARQRDETYADDVGRTGRIDAVGDEFAERVGEAASSYLRSVDDSAVTNPPPDDILTPTSEMPSEIVYQDDYDDDAHWASTAASPGGIAAASVDNDPDTRFSRIVSGPSDELIKEYDDITDYDDESAGHFYLAGDGFIKVWDAKAYVEATSTEQANDTWLDTYDRAAKLKRQMDPYGLDTPMLMRELIPSAEYADDLLPLCSDVASATYRISNIRRGLLRFGGVKLNMTKLKFLLIRRPVKIRITNDSAEEHSQRQTSWFPCAYCTRRFPSKMGLRQHEQSCRHPARDPTVANPGGPKGGKSYYVNRIADCAGGSDNRWYLVVWSHSEDPTAGMLPGDPGHFQWIRSPQHGPYYPDTWEHDCNVGAEAKRAIAAYFKQESRPGFGPELDCTDPEIIRCTWCNDRFEWNSELKEHLQMCESRPRPLYGTAAHRHAKRQQMEDNCGADLARVRLLCA